MQDKEKSADDFVRAIGDRQVGRSPSNGVGGDGGNYASRMLGFILFFGGATGLLLTWSAISAANAGAESFVFSPKYLFMEPPLALLGALLLAGGGGAMRWLMGMGHFAWAGVAYVGVGVILGLVYHVLVVNHIEALGYTLEVSHPLLEALENLGK